MAEPVSSRNHHGGNLMIRTLLCNQCGAALECPESTRFVRCNHCQSQLEIQQTPDATFTKVVEQLAGTTESISNHLAKIEHQQSLAELDRQWGYERQKYLNPDQSIPQSPNLLLVAILVGVPSGIFFVVCILGSFISTSFLCGLFVPLMMVVLTGLGYYYSHQKAAAYQAAESRYLAKRQHLAQQSPRQPPQQPPGS